MERLKKIGQIKPKSARDITSSKIGIGFEKLDRDVFDPHKAYDKVAALGVKWVRIQSGWARTEKVKGVYDFGWLDDIVDNLLSRALKPWMCLCYGNGIYDADAAKVFGAVGCPPIKTPEQVNAWDAYVRAVALHFKGRVDHYEVWNEPDGIWCWKHGVNATELGTFTLRTAKALKETDAGLYVIGLAVCHRDLKYMNEALQTGMGNYLDAISFHEYTPDERQVAERVRAMRSLAHRYNPKIEIIQGESGSQSQSDGNGALKTGAWTPRKQAKQLLRHAFADIISGVKFTSYFSCMDMIEALNGVAGDKGSYLDYGYFGVLAADFDENGFATGEYKPKPSYYALQALASALSDAYEPAELPILHAPAFSNRYFTMDLRASAITDAGFKKPNGSYAYVYWNPSDLMTTEFEATVSMEIAAMAGNVKLVDMFDGSVYTIPESMITKDAFGCMKINALPIKDYPLMLTFGDFIELA